MNATLVERPFDPSTARRLEASGLPAPLARVLAARGILRIEELHLVARDLIPPLSLSHVDAAARLLADAIEANQGLLIVADYDCDGATACAVGMRGLRALGAQVDFIVPNRFEYGYGLTPEIVELAASRSPRPDLLITVDNGIASVDGVARANALGLRVLVTDHHLPGDRLPDAAVIVNPNQPGCGFPSKNLAGVGVMFYVLLALRAEQRARGRFSETDQPRLDVLLDLVALGTVADVVRLDRNNRILVAEGLKRIRDGRMNAGLAALFQVAGRDARTAQASDLGFTIGPRINAAGRLADMALGIECLITENFDRALELARQLDQINRERRVIEADMQWDALAELEDARFDKRRTITLFNDSWHHGVVGLVASRVKEKFHRPTVAFARADDLTLRGSGRSIEGVHLRDMLDLVTKSAPTLIDKFGGHAMAAGLTLAFDKLAAFEQAFEAATQMACEASLFTRTIATDGGLVAHDITLTLADALAREIWGQGFAAPLFVNEFTVLEQRLVKDAHLKLKLLLGELKFDAMWFRHTEAVPARVRLAYRLTSDTWQGQRRITLVIEHASL